MTVVTTRPDSTITSSSVSIGGGAGSVHAALADDSDSTYIARSTNGDYSALVGMASPTIPAGSVIKLVQLRARVALAAAGSEQATLVATSGPIRPNSAVVTVNWSTPVTITAPITVTPVEPLISAAFSGSAAGTPVAVRLYELYADTTYVAEPVVNVTAPVSPVTDTNMPTIAWENTLDSDGGPQTYSHLKIFTDAQYSAGGFDPTTSSAFVEGLEPNSEPSVTLRTAVLPDDTYRAYVKVAQTVNGALHWSDWDYIEFTVAVVPPADPTLTLTPEDANGRVRIDLAANSGPATTGFYELERSLDTGTSWEPVRLSVADDEDEDGLIVNGGAGVVVYDYEAPNGTAVQYRARALHDYAGVYAASAWAEDTTTWSSTPCWLKHPRQPGLNTTIEIVSYSEQQRAGRQGVFQPLGSRLPVVVSDTRGGASGPLVIRTASAAERAAVDALLDTYATLLIQVPAAADEPDRYVRITDHGRVRAIDKSFTTRRTETLAWVEVAQPSGLVVEWP